MTLQKPTQSPVPELKFPPVPESVGDPSQFTEQFAILTDIFGRASAIIQATGAIDASVNAMCVNCIHRLQPIVKYTDKFNIFQISKDADRIKQVYLISGELMFRTVNLAKDTLSDIEKNNCTVGIAHLRKVLDIDPFHAKAMELFKLLYSILANHTPVIQEAINLLKQVLYVVPHDFGLHFSMGRLYVRANDLDTALYHFKLALGIVGPQGDKHARLVILNNLALIYQGVQNRDLALYYLNLAYTIDENDPEINNVLGVVYTELRISDKALFHYNRGIENIDKCTGDRDMTLASMYMNSGLAYCYECNFEAGIAAYNKALQVKPTLVLAYQNKLLDSNYISHLVDDPMYIPKLHKSINKLYPKVLTKCAEYVPKPPGSKLVLGFVSGDFVCHPVSYFMRNILEYIDDTRFEVHCFSAKLVGLEQRYPRCKWHIAKGLSAEQLKALIQSMRVDVLFDLSSHTNDNRLDTFVLKPAPVQISYCGYPNSAGIKSMDYRITDRIADDAEHSQKYYTEKFIFMDHCFLNYRPETLDGTPVPLAPQPCTANEYITFGCFNRFNKVNNAVISAWEDILVAIPTARLVVKTKEFSTEKIKKQFLNTFKDQTLTNRITVLEYADTYLTHLPDYNKIDVALDTFPYSGTTTSCEALYMGVPVLTLFDNVRWYHSQNVTASLMKNSKLAEFVTYSRAEYIARAVELSESIGSGSGSGSGILGDLKPRVRELFVNGNVCVPEPFVREFENKIVAAFNECTERLK